MFPSQVMILINQKKKLFKNSFVLPKTLKMSGIFRCVVVLWFGRTAPLRHSREVHHAVRDRLNGSQLARRR